MAGRGPRTEGAGGVHAAAGEGPLREHPRHHRQPDAQRRRVLGRCGARRAPRVSAPARRLPCQTSSARCGASGPGGAEGLGGFSERHQTRGVAEGKGKRRRDGELKGARRQRGWMGGWNACSPGVGEESRGVELQGGRWCGQRMGEEGGGSGGRKGGRRSSDLNTTVQDMEEAVHEME